MSTSTPGPRVDRPALRELQRVLRAGDKIVVESLNRVSRKSVDLVALLEDWHGRGISFESDKEHLSIGAAEMGTALGKLQLAIFAAMAQFERDNLVERTLEGLAAARERGRVGGRPRSDEKAVQKAIRLYSAGTHSVREVCQLTKVSKSVLYRELKLRREAAQTEGESGGTVSEE
ncbi:recombinase family protein [Alicyclobacillus suci]|uniref:recombinase family protein n=1 Tax=Alicyclobacillus suci TaxID=2816080 RepID=UPI001A8EBB31|nr:recombinase family protein [Alicyclobacillus suci]